MSCASRKTTIASSELLLSPSITQPRRSSLSFDPQRAIVLPHDDIPFVDGLETIARIHRQHRETHAEVRRQDLVAAQPLHFVVIHAGVEEFLHGVRSFGVMEGRFIG